MDYLPIFLAVRDEPCLLVGGSQAAEPKARLLLRAGARLVVVAADLTPGLRELTDRIGVTWHRRRFRDGDMDGMRLVIVAVKDEALARAVAAAARKRGIPVNAVDRRPLCSFILPSILDRSPLVAAVSTGGAAPILARILRARLETVIPAQFGRLARFLGEIRPDVLGRIADSAQRRRFFEGVVDGPIGEQVLAGREDEARDAIASALDEHEKGDAQGEVYLVGAGPGDPDLLTFRALRLMQKADVVVYDRLVSNAVLDLTRRDAERIYAGKQPGHHAIPQHEINDLLARLALAGKRVLRLKGGDPFIFGRGGEEIETLAALGVPFQVVPGITAASGCAAYAGIPLTHRDHAQSCIFVTGRRKIEEQTLDWDSLVRPNQTVVIYMGLAGLEAICDGLLRHGLASETPAALIEQGTTAAQVVHTGTVGTLASSIEGKGVRAPTLAIVGEVVRLRDKLAWYHPRRSAVSAFISRTGGSGSGE
ncbi:MAG: siroheme synthase CysG [Chromatiales bacterium]|nr:siroheme synthase CysG [Chromatiales bacterium]